MSKGYVIEYKDEYGSGTGYSFKKFNTRYEVILKVQPTKVCSLYFVKNNMSLFEFNA
jgi:hypothetical protein